MRIHCTIVKHLLHSDSHGICACSRGSDARDPPRGTEAYSSKVARVTRVVCRGQKSARVCVLSNMAVGDSRSQ